jgi:methylase of polypeptide subunit release factors
MSGMKIPQIDGSALVDNTTQKHLLALEQGGAVFELESGTGFISLESAT